MVSTDSSVKNQVPTKSKTDVKAERFAFSADIKKLLGLIINTFYTNKDVFLREVVSNASDAIDKIKFKSLTDMNILGDETNFKIEISADKENKTLTIRDTGIGMTKADLIKNLGTIATSGTKSFMDAIKAGADIQMIGQFGVGFYSVFLVAENVKVRSKHNDDKQYVWESTAGGEFDVYDDSTNPHQLKRGTELILHLKEDQLEYLEERRIKEVLKKHSGFVGKEIYLLTEKEIEKEVTDDEGEEENKKVEEIKEEKAEEAKEKDQTEEKKDGKIEEVKEKEPEKKKKKITEVKSEWTLVSESNPIWLQKPSEVKKEDYAKFYKSISNDWEEPLAYKHFHIEGQFDFKGIIFIPKRAPYDLYNSNKNSNNIKLYVRRVFINDNSKQLCSDYLGFVRGVVDSDEMPLNISRESLQENNIMRIIKKNVDKKSLELMQDIMEGKDKEKQKTFYQQFAKNIKYGIHEDTSSRLKLASLLRYQTSKSGKDLKSLSDYVRDMQKHQKDIYFLSGDSLESMKKLPFLEALIDKGFEVLFMTDPIDEYCVQQLTEFEGHKLVSITKEGLELPMSDEEKAALEAEKKEFEPLCKRMKEVLGNKVENVVVSVLMKDSPCSVSTSRYGMSSRMEQIMKHQALKDTSLTSHMHAKKFLELNTKHPIIKLMNSRFKEDRNDPVLKNLVFLLFETSVITSGGLVLEDPNGYSKRIFEFIKTGLNIVEEEKEDELPKLEEVSPEVAKEEADMEDVE